MTPQQTAFLKTAILVIVALHVVAAAVLLIARLISRHEAEAAGHPLSRATPPAAMCRAAPAEAAAAQASNRSFSLSPGS